MTISQDCLHLINSLRHKHQPGQAAVGGQAVTFVGTQFGFFAQYAVARQLESGEKLVTVNDFGSVIHSGNDSRCFALRVMPDLRNLFRNTDQLRQGVLCIQCLPFRVGFIALKVQAQGGAFGTGPR